MDSSYIDKKITTSVILLSFLILPMKLSAGCFKKKRKICRCVAGYYKDCFGDRQFHASTNINSIEVIGLIRGKPDVFNINPVTSNKRGGDVIDDFFLEANSKEDVNKELENCRDQITDYDICSE